MNQQFKVPTPEQYAQIQKSLEQVMEGGWGSVQIMVAEGKITEIRISRLYKVLTTPSTETDNAIR